jgi:hypothetical protein
MGKKTYFTFINEAKVSPRNFDKAVTLFASLFQKKIGAKLYRFGGKSGYTQIKDGIGILYFYNRNKAIRFNYINNDIKSITLWNSYKLGESGDKTISFENIGLTQAALKLLEVIKNDLQSGTVINYLPESISSNCNKKFLSEATQIKVKDAIKLIKKHLNGTPLNAVSWIQITETLAYYDHCVPTIIRKTKYGRGANARYDLTQLVDDDSTSTACEPIGTIKIKSGDDQSSGINPSIDGDKQTEKFKKQINNAITNPDVKKDMNNPNTLFGFMKNLVQIVARKARNSLIIYGGPGTGKSFTVFQTLKEEGLQRGSDYFLVKGKITTAELYKHLFMHRKGKIIVFDDTDSVWQDKDAANMLKAALDSYDERVISWYSARTFNVSTLDNQEKEEYNNIVDDSLGDPESKTKFPSEFVYNGRIIFISNLTHDKFDSAVLTRSAKIDMSLTQEQMFLRMEGILDKLGDESISIEIKKEILSYLKEENKTGHLKNISMRTFTAALDLYKSGLPNWQELLSFV